MSDREESVDRLDNGDGGSSPMDDNERNGGSEPDSGSHGSENGHSPRPSGRSRSRSHSPSRRHGRRSRSRSRSRSKNGSRIKRHSPDRIREDGYRPRHRSRSPGRRNKHQVNRENPPAGRCLGIFGLSIYTQERDLKDVFGKYGNIEDVQIVYDAQTGRSRGFAFVYFEDKNDAAAAKDQCNGIEMDGRKIRVDFSVTQRAHTPTPGIYMGRPTNSPRNRRGHGPKFGGFRSDRGRGFDHHHHHHHHHRGPRRSPSPYRNSGNEFNNRRVGGFREHHGPPVHRYRSRSRSFSPQFKMFR